MLAQCVSVAQIGSKRISAVGATEFLPPIRGRVSGARLAPTQLNHIQHSLSALDVRYNIGMVIHTFAFRWKPDVTEEQKLRVQTEIRALQGHIPGLLETYVGANFSSRSQGYALGGVMKFTDRAALEAYGPSPVHQKLLQWLMPLIDPVEVDFEA